MTGPWAAGQEAIVAGFKGRVELNFQTVRLQAWLPSQARWKVTMIGSGEAIAVTEATLFDTAMDHAAVETRFAERAAKAAAESAAAIKTLQLHAEERKAAAAAAKAAAERERLETTYHRPQSRTTELRLDELIHALKASLDVSVAVKDKEKDTERYGAKCEKCPWKWSQGMVLREKTREEIVCRSRNVSKRVSKLQVVLWLIGRTKVLAAVCRQWREATRECLRDPDLQLGFLMWLSESLKNNRNRSSRDVPKHVESIIEFAHFPVPPSLANRRHWLCSQPDAAVKVMNIDELSKLGAPLTIMARRLACGEGACLHFRARDLVPNMSELLKEAGVRGHLECHEGRDWCKVNCRASIIAPEPSSADQRPKLLVAGVHVGYIRGLIEIDPLPANQHPKLRVHEQQALFDEDDRILLGEAWCEANFDPNDPFALSEEEEQEVEENGGMIDTFLVRALPESCVT